MGEERRFRSHFQVVGERRRQRIHDDRRLYRSRSPAQCWRSKKNGPQAIGRSRGGLTTKIHALVDALGNPVELMLTPGQDHDLTCAEPLIENADPEALIGDKAYDADPFVETLTQRGITPVIPPKANRNIKRECDFALYCERNLVERFFNLLKHFRAIATRCDKAYDADPFVETLTQRGITPVIPPKANRNIKRECDFALYCERNLVERFFNLLKHFRAIATRYDKLARNFLAGVQLAAVTILLN